MRRTVYVPALVAVQRKAQLKAKYCGLIEAEKPPKLALTAIMRRLVIRTLKEQCVHRHRFESIQHASRAVYDIEELREAVARLKGGDPVAEAAVAEAEEAAGRLQRKAG